MMEKSLITNMASGSSQRAFDVSGNRGAWISVFVLGALVLLRVLYALTALIPSLLPDFEKRSVQ